MSDSLASSLCLAKDWGWGSSNGPDKLKSQPGLTTGRLRAHSTQPSLTSGHTQGA